MAVVPTEAFSVPMYRALVIGSDARPLRAHNFESPNSGEATKIALGYMDGRPIELWQGDAGDVEAHQTLEGLARPRIRRPQRNAASGASTTTASGKL